MAELKIDDEVFENATKLAEHANQHKVSLEIVRLRASGMGPSIGDDEKFVLKIPDGWHVVYCIEEQPEPAGWCHHFGYYLELESGERLAPPPDLFIQAILPMFRLNVSSPISVWKETVDNGCCTNLVFAFNNTVNN
jgi:hypothetical protein